MKDQYAKEYYDKLQEIRDTEDESAQRPERNGRVTLKKLRYLARILDAFTKSTLPSCLLETVWKTEFGSQPEWKSITEFVLSGSK